MSTDFALTTSAPPTGGTTTTVPDRGPIGEPPRRRQLGGISKQGTYNFLGSLGAALAVDLLLFGRLAPLSGLIASVVVSYLVFLGTYALLVRQTESGPAVTDAVMTIFLYSAAALVLLAFVQIIGYTFLKGHAALFHGNFYTEDLSRTNQYGPLTSGGIKHAMIGTLWTISIALAISVPLGLVGAVYLSEARGRMVRFVRTIVEAMAGLPDIIAGLFIFATWILLLHEGFSGLAAALALSISMLPIIIRAADVVLRLVPGNLREASSAMAAPAWRTVWHVVLPTARSGLATAVILGAARGVGETAPVLLTSGYTTFTNNNPLHGPMVTLPFAAYTLVASGVPNMVIRGFGAAFVLLLIVVVLFVTARIIGGRGPGHLSNSKRRRVARQSARDLARFEDNTNESITGEAA